jgi:hypothetical protein
MMADNRAREINGADDEDEALRIAIAMSLGLEPQKKETPKKRPDTIDLTQDDTETASEGSSPGKPVVKDPGGKKKQSATEKPRPIAEKEKKQEQPAAHKKQSSAEKTQPVVKKQPATEKTQPTAEKRQPAAEKKQLTAEKTQPATEKRQPAAEKKQSTAAVNDLTPNKPQPTEVSSMSTGLSLLALDRQKMEEERLARIRKRKAAEEGEDHESGNKRPKTNGASSASTVAGNVQGRRDVQQHLTAAGKATKEVPLDSPQKQPMASLGEKKSTNPSHQQNTVPKSKQGAMKQAPIPITKKEQNNLPFPKGTVKKTWVRGLRRQGDDIRIEEVLQKDQLELAVISSFQWDQEWMMKVVDLRKTKLVLIAMGGDEAEVRF